MTLRDIQHWLHGIGDQFGRDVALAADTSIMDWPIYLIVLAAPLAFIAVGIAAVIFAMIITPFALGFEWFANKHWDRDGNPISKFGRGSDLVLNILWKCLKLSILWLPLSMGWSFIVPQQVYQLPTLGWLLIVFGIPAVSIAFVVYVASTIKNNK